MRFGFAEVDTGLEVDGVTDNVSEEVLWLRTSDEVDWPMLDTICGLWTGTGGTTKDFF
jgi:hypothetical protein